MSYAYFDKKKKRKKNVIKRKVEGSIKEKKKKI